MADEAMDPCECLSHEVAVRRLLNLLRQTQSYCTDTECLEQINAPNAAGNFMLTALLVGFALLIYMLRPRSTTSSVEREKHINNNQGPLPPPDAPAN